MPDEDAPGGGPGERPGERPEDRSNQRPADASAPEPERGRMRFQDETTTPREPTLAERRAREQAQRRAEEAERREAERREQAATRRRRVLVGAGVTVGVVALIAVAYSVAQPEDEVQAHCVDEETNTIVDDSNCVTPADGAYHAGGGFYPIFIGVGGGQYHYNYGGTGTIGERAQGGTATVPKAGTRVTTSSGPAVVRESGTVSRGGLGVSRGGSSSGS